MDVIVRNASVIVTMDNKRRILKNFSIGIEDGKIVEIAEKIPCEADFLIDARGKLVIPGLINTHTHAAMTLLRGLADDMPLMKWLKEEIWPTEAKLKASHVYAGTLLACMEMIAGGVTCFNDMYFYPEMVAKSIEETGIRGVISYAMFDFGKSDIAESIVKEGEHLIKKYGNSEGRVRVALAPHAPYTCSEELLKLAKETAEKHGLILHIHVAETRDEVKEIKEKTGFTPVEYLDKIGFLGKNVVAAHMVWLTDKELSIVKKRGVKVSHNPISNLKLASGIARVDDMIKKGIVVSLGTDGAASNNSLDMFESMKTCAIVQKVYKNNPEALKAEKVLEMATINGARALGMEKEIGSIEIGKRADIAIIDLKHPNLIPVTNPVSHLVYTAKACNVETVIVDGKIVMENREFRTIDYDKVINFAMEQAHDLLSEAGKEEKLFVKFIEGI